MVVEKKNSNSYICIFFVGVGGGWVSGGGWGGGSKIRTEKLLSKVFDYYVKLLLLFCFSLGVYVEATVFQSYNGGQLT